jgi:O-antigen ligase
MSNRVTAAALATILVLGLLLAWVPDPWAVHLEQGLLFTLAGAWFAGRAFRPAPVRLHVGLMVPVLAALWGAAQWLTHRTQDRWATQDAVFYWLAAAAAMFLAMQCFADTGLRERWLRRFLWFGLAMALFAVLQYYTSPDKIFWKFETGRTLVAGTIGYRNHYAAFIELVFPVALWLATTARNPLPYLAAAGAVAATNVVVQARAGTGLVACEAIVWVAILYFRRRVSRRALGLLAAGLAVAVVAALAVGGYEALLERLRNGIHEETRLLIDQSSLTMLRDRPWSGYGLGSWTTVYPAYAFYDQGLFVNAAHNDWLEWTCDGGLPLILVIGLLAVTSIPAGLRSIWALGICSLFLHALVDFPFRLFPLAVLAFALMGTAAIRDGCQTGDGKIRNNVRNRRVFTPGWPW